MTENVLRRCWRRFWNPQPPKGVKAAADAQTEATTRLVRRIEGNTARGKSLFVGVERDLSDRHGNGHGHAD